MKRIILKWLGLDKELEKIKHELSIAHANTKTLYSEITVLKQFIDVSIDVDDIGRRYRCWGVISIQGKRDYLKFFDLEENDLRKIQYFMKQFEQRNITADLPYMMSKDFFFKS